MYLESCYFGDVPDLIRAILRSFQISYFSTELALCMESQIPIALNLRGYRSDHRLGYLISSDL